MIIQRPLVHVDGASVHYGAKHVLEATNLEVNPGEIVSIVGPNGGGKSTLVRLVLGVIWPTSGTVKKRPGIEIGCVPRRLDTLEVFSHGWPRSSW